MSGHPILRASIHVYQRHDTNDGGARWNGHFHPRSAYPVIAYGDSMDEVLSKLEALRKEAIEKHGAAVIARQQAKEKAAATRAKKKEATQ